MSCFLQRSAYPADGRVFERPAAQGSSAKKIVSGAYFVPTAKLVLMRDISINCLNDSELAEYISTFLYIIFCHIDFKNA